LDGAPRTIEVAGEVAPPPAATPDPTLEPLYGTQWFEAGYGLLSDWLTPEEHASFAARVLAAVQEAARSVGLPAPVSLARYHEAVQTRAANRKLMTYASKTYRMASLMPAPFIELAERLPTPLNSRLFVCGHRSSVRIIRPGELDYNPLHKDTWLPNLPLGLNGYVPLAGSNALSSLPLVPSSHRWPLSGLRHTDGGACFNGQNFTVPSLVHSEWPLALIRPNPGPRSLLFFTPSLIHGLAVNEGQTTRVSLELRFRAREEATV
jgi:hypothetical protein